MAKLLSKSRIAVWVLSMGLLVSFAMTARSAMLQPDNMPGPQLGLPSARPAAPTLSPPEDTNDPQLRKIQAQQAHRLNDERQKQLVKDTDHLLELATELKAEVSKTDEDTLSIDVIKKSAEIQKLAKSVEEKMKAD